MAFVESISKLDWTKVFRSLFLTVKFQCLRIILVNLSMDKSFFTNRKAESPCIQCPWLPAISALTAQSISSVASEQSGTPLQRPRTEIVSELLHTYNDVDFILGWASKLELFVTLIFRCGSGSNRNAR